MSGSELAVIQDTKFLREQFDRMLLKLVDASDGYIDYASLRFPSAPCGPAANMTLTAIPATT
ncbi:MULTISPECIES: hypothetical protein [unclassified Bradyrhizobium]|uniref:hypothetical protein n=1 Tax=unclassified Bradyrhizobium TaxID=2631580 RepID=UPI000488E4DC|nr:hypothetical protein [Bradyrhizobium sp. WSM1417]